MAYGAVPFEFVNIPKGEFQMGEAASDRHAFRDEIPIHRVTIPEDFQIGKYEVTQAQWMTVMGSNPSNFRNDGMPVHNVSWLDVHKFLDRLNDRRDGFQYRLPTEAEWEYVAKAGSQESHYGSMDGVAQYKDNSRGLMAHIGTKSPNAFGVFDMLGNVFEWCEDWYDPGYYRISPGVAPKGPVTGVLNNRKVRRGGSWNSTPRQVRASNRNSLPLKQGDNQTGFRIVRQPWRK